MRQEQYSFIRDSRRFYYEFYSIGPKGRVKKVVEYNRFTKLETESYNLSFGDWNEAGNCFDDMISTNNGDRNKVLATVAATVIDFMQHHADATLFVAGSTPARNRLYQMGIAGAWEEINMLFKIRGFVDGEWKSFQKGVNYTAFLLEYK
jgi:hypothetical protein